MSGLTTVDIKDKALPISKLDFIEKVYWLISNFYTASGKDADELRIRTGVEHSFKELLLSQGSADFDQVILNKSDWLKVLQSIFSYIDGVSIQMLENADAARLPIIGLGGDNEPLVVKEFNSFGEWMVEGHQIGKKLQKNLDGFFLLRPKFESNFEEHTKSKTAYKIFKTEFLLNKATFIEVAVASVLINLLALGTSLYSMQVYDRVIPTQSYSTLIVLTSGVLITICFELFIKLIRSHLMRESIIKMDSQFSRKTFSQLLNIRLDQLPASVGSLSGQLRGYETIRSFISSATVYILVDVPFAIFYIFLVGFIGSPIAAVVPLVFLVISLSFGFVMKSKAMKHANLSIDSSNEKTGLLVEAIEGAETLKSGSSSWRMLSKWIDVSEKTIFHDMSLRAINEKSTYFSALFQQISSIGLVAVGAYLTTQGEMTMGSLIACTILSGRALAPMAQIPSLMVQAAGAKAALDRLERIFTLQLDNHDVDKPLLPSSIKGKYVLEDVKFHYKDSPNALIIDKLVINPGEKVGIIGPIGAGKSTLLRLLTGMFKPNEGKVFLDDLDVGHLGRRFLSESIGYLQQEHRLFKGTLRENLLIGMPDPGDDIIKQVASDSGLLEAISRNPKGLDMMISEGGKGLSGGQRQLVALTRLLMTKSTVWLLDEPTASMDINTESKSIQALKNKIKSDDTFLLVTHKMPLLSLVDRVICIVNHQIVLDGPRDEILRKLGNTTNK